MNKLVLVITAALFGLVALASAQTWTRITPRYGGGYNYYQYGNPGYSWGTMTPRYGGGYDFYRYGNPGYSWGTMTPRYGGGYDFYQYGD